MLFWGKELLYAVVWCLFVIVGFMFGVKPLQLAGDSRTDSLEIQAGRSDENKSIWKRIMLSKNDMIDIQ